MGEPYENTLPCSQALNLAGRDARYLGLIPAGAIIDRRNPEAVVNFENESDEDAEVSTDAGFLYNPDGSALPNKTSLSLPSITLSAPTISQRFHLEIWCEKSTMNDVLMPLGDDYGINIITAMGEMSATACELFVARATESDRPVRILYVSDFDPAGMGMPVAAARKIEFYARRLALDIQVRPIVLTHDQCVEYELPRVPIKETERRGAKFEERFGEGATELDALEAIHPGVLREILAGEIARYHDHQLEDNIQDVVNEAERDVDLANQEVRGRHLDQIAELEAECDSINAEAAEALGRRKQREEALKLRAEPLMRTMMGELLLAEPDVDDYDWPEAADGDEDDDPMYDSNRSYIEQVDRYRLHQGKGEEVTSLWNLRKFTLTCSETTCGKTFIASRANAKTCGTKCARKLRRSAERKLNAKP